VNEKPRSCYTLDGRGKLTYSTSKRAHQAAREQSRYFDGKKQAYHCRECGFYHLATKK
jgi:hypothetical protein